MRKREMTEFQTSNLTARRAMDTALRKIALSNASTQISPKSVAKRAWGYLNTPGTGQVAPLGLSRESTFYRWCLKKHA